ncbi:uncharacterized protein METZ01_LOCUS502302, partial [marine metagenome]
MTGRFYLELHTNSGSMIGQSRPQDFVFLRSSEDAGNVVALDAIYANTSL